MYERKYMVKIDGNIVAEKLTIQCATILLKALFEEYYNDRAMEISIKEMEPTEGGVSNGNN